MDNLGAIHKERGPDNPDVWGERNVGPLLTGIHEVSWSPRWRTAVLQSQLTAVHGFTGHKSVADEALR